MIVTYSASVSTAKILWFGFNPLETMEVGWNFLLSSMLLNIQSGQACNDYFVMLWLTLVKVSTKVDS